MQRAGTIEVIMVNPLKPAEIKRMGNDLEAMQAAVGGLIEEYMPFKDDVAIVCNEEGKIRGMTLNRGIKDENGQLMDIIAGPFFIAYAPPESEIFQSMPDQLKEKYLNKFRNPERFLMTRSGIKVEEINKKKDEMVR